MHDGELRFVDANEARFGFSDSHLLAYLQVPVEKDLLSQCPADVDAPDQMLGLLRHRSADFFVARCCGLLSSELRRHLEEQLPEENDVDEGILGSISV